MNFKNSFFATGIGSLPFLDAKTSVAYILDSFSKHIPFWPQLPKISFFESMHIQYSEGFPGRVIELDKKNMYINTQSPSFIEEFENCFNAINDNNLDYFAISSEYAAGLYEFIKELPGRQFSFVKGQVIGPISYGMILLDDKNKPLLFNPELGEIVPQFLGLKAKWQIRQFKKITKANIILFVDEPYLVAVGTGQFGSLDKSAIISKINSVVRAIHSEGALAGIHCCGNTDWSICLETDIDILSFDAFGFLDSLFIYKDNLNKFIKKNGILACGIVPNNQDFNLDGYLEKAIEVLKKKQMFLENGALITPSCGCGTLSIDSAQKVNKLAIEIAEACYHL